MQGVGGFLYPPQRDIVQICIYIPTQNFFQFFKHNSYYIAQLLLSLHSIQPTLIYLHEQRLTKTLGSETIQRKLP